MYLKDLLSEEELEIKKLFRKFVDNEIMPRRLEVEENKNLVEEICDKSSSNSLCS